TVKPMPPSPCARACERRARSSSWRWRSARLASTPSPPPARAPSCRWRRSSSNSKPASISSSCPSRRAAGDARAPLGRGRHDHQRPHDAEIESRERQAARARGSRFCGCTCGSDGTPKPTYTGSIKGGEAMRTMPIALACVALALSSGSFAQPQPPAKGTVVITLGTGGGPLPRAHRAQASNLLVVNGTPYLIDAGDGALRRIVRAGYDFRQITKIFITHAHSDHTNGL